MNRLDVLLRYVSPWHPSGCWQWTGSVDAGGYGRWAGSYAHRFAYETLVGPIGAGLAIDHLCRNHGCVNPDHLEPVTWAENNRRKDSLMGTGAYKTHCAQGHAYDAANTYVFTGYGYTKRTCRACNREAQRRRAQRNAATTERGAA